MRQPLPVGRTGMKVALGPETRNSSGKDLRRVRDEGKGAIPLQASCRAYHLLQERSPNP